MKGLSVLLCSLLLVACAELTLDSWKGKHRADLINYYGTPMNETALLNGGTQLVYETWFYPWLVCYDTYTTDTGGVVTAWSRSCY